MTRETWCGHEVVLIGRADARGRVVAAKEAGAEHVIGVGRAVVMEDDLAPGDLILPADVLDFTHSTPTTFFETRGLGYLQQSPPFCPETRAALLRVAGAREVGIVAAGPNRPFTPAELRAWRTLGAAVAMRDLAPAWYLCHELELGYAALGWIAWVDGCQPDSTPDWQSTLAPALAALPSEHSWQGSNTAARAALGDDWRAWIAPDDSPRML